MFQYSERPGTMAARRHDDDVPLDVKKLRLQEIIARQKEISLERNQQDLNKFHQVLIEGPSKRSMNHLQGRNSANKVIVFPKDNQAKGDYVSVFVENCTSATLLGHVINEN